MYVLEGWVKVAQAHFQNADAVQKLDAEDCSDDEMESEKQRLQMIEDSPIINVRRDMTSAHVEYATKHMLR